MCLILVITDIKHQTHIFQYLYHIDIYASENQEHIILHLCARKEFYIMNFI